MKVRILGNTLRFRVRQPEVQQFEQEGYIEEVTVLGPSEQDQLRFVLQVTDNGTLGITFAAGTTTVLVPQAVASAWTSTEQVGFDGSVGVGNGNTVKVLVEKDFVCLDRPEEEEVGAYPNPTSIC